MNQTVAASRAVGACTRTNAAILAIIAAMPHESRNAEISNQLTAYANFLLSKERAGIERAVMTNTFARDSFGPWVHAKFSGLVTEQKTYLDVFNAIV